MTMTFTSSMIQRASSASATTLSLRISSLAAHAVAASAVLAGAMAATAIAADGTQQTADNGAAAAKARVAADVAKVLEQYIVAPQAASDLGCRVKWQATVPLAQGQTVKMVASSSTAVLALDSRNQASLIRPETGDRAWTASAADPIDHVLALGVFPYVGRSESDNMRIGVVADTVYYTIGFDGGATLGRTRYHHVPNTTPQMFSRWFIYGTRSGQVSWLDCATGSDLKCHTVDALHGKAPVIAAPAIGEDTVVGASSAGGVVSLDAKTGGLNWTKELLAGVSASPAIAKGVVFIASEDQYLYAFDLRTGATLWKYFTQTALRSSPFAAGDVVLQDVPGEGLVALTQNPEAQPGGEVRWRRAHVAGSPIGVLDGAAMFWCPVGHVVTLVDLKKGDIVRTVSLPSVTSIEADTIEAGGFIAWSSDGRVERLAPMNPPAAAAAPAVATK